YVILLGSYVLLRLIGKHDRIRTAPSLIGGLAGLFLVWLLTLAPFGSLEVILSPANIILGLGVSSTIGLVAGIVPAAVAARLDPVIAIRAN
ncbi:MAG: hypothetical protein QM734_09330, partial [Cyclobacteriaceae bacterium]